jgi:hypothetical protein
MLRTPLGENQRETNDQHKSPSYNGMSNQLPPQTRISIAYDSDRDSIYALRQQWTRRVACTVRQPSPNAKSFWERFQPARK